MNAADWYRDAIRYDAAIKPHLETTEDGFTYVGDTCPDDLLKSYERFVQVGYANGFIGPN